MTDSTATTPQKAASLASATQVRRCAKCGSHFPSDFEEPRCANCVAWAELTSSLIDYRRAINARPSTDHG